MVKSAVYRRSPNLASRVIDGEAIVIRPDTSEIHVLNDTGARVWELVDGARTLAAIAEQIAGEYEVSLEAAGRDVTDLMMELESKSLVQAAENGDRL